jgi:hypothetical protein
MVSYLQSILRRPTTRSSGPSYKKYAHEGFDTKWCYKIKNFVQGGGRVGIKVKEDISPYF